MPKFIQSIHPAIFVLIAATLEVCGDAIVRSSIYNHTGAARLGFLLIGSLLLLGYGTFLNLAPVEFGKVIGLYIISLFVIWQIVTYISFKTVPSTPVLIGGALIIAGGAIIHFWKEG